MTTVREHYDRRLGPVYTRIVVYRVAAGSM